MEKKLEPGVILKAGGGFFTVYLDKNMTLLFQARGRFKKEGVQFLAGDRVEVNLAEKMIEKILPRRTELYRPPIANVEQAIILFSFKNPPLSLTLLDRLLALAEANYLKILLCLNKTDLVTPADAGDIQDIVDIYQHIGYRVITMSVLKDDKAEQVKPFLEGKISVVAGPSGVGKSALLNKLHPGLKLRTGLISKKMKRGRHTTRQVALIPLESGGLVADTPGFSQLLLKGVFSGELTFFFPEIFKLAAGCRFNSCLHLSEPGCVVREKAGTEKLAASRYKNYLQILKEIQEMERSY